MTAEGSNPAEDLRRVITEAHISEDALQAMTGIQPEKLRSFLDEAQPGMVGVATGSPVR